MIAHLHLVSLELRRTQMTKVPQCVSGKIKSALGDVLLKCLSLLLSVVGVFNNNNMVISYARTVDWEVRDVLLLKVCVVS